MKHRFVDGVHGVRYLVKDVARNGQQQEPGGWNRVVLRVNELPAFIEVLKREGLHFRNDMETGPGGKQIQIEDPDGNPIELFEPAR